MSTEAAPRGGHPATGTGHHASYLGDVTEVDRLLAEIRRYQEASGAIVQDETLSFRGKCAALVELGRRARREQLVPAGFAEAAIWGWARTILQPDAGFPGDKVQAAIRRLRARGLVRCDSCERELPDERTLDRWTLLRHESYRPRRPT
jgi:hypothetical protein